MTALELYALLSPVIAFVVMSVLAAVLMTLTRRDLEKLARKEAVPGVQTGVAASQPPGSPNTAQQRAPSLAEH